MAAIEIIQCHGLMAMAAIESDQFINAYDKTGHYDQGLFFLNATKITDFRSHMKICCYRNKVKLSCLSCRIITKFYLTHS